MKYSCVPSNKTCVLGDRSLRVLAPDVLRRFILANSSECIDGHQKRSGMYVHLEMIQQCLCIIKSDTRVVYLESAHPYICGSVHAVIMNTSPVECVIHIKTFDEYVSLRGKEYSASRLLSTWHFSEPILHASSCFPSRSTKVLFSKTIARLTLIGKLSNNHITTNLMQLIFTYNQHLRYKFITSLKRHTFCRPIPPRALLTDIANSTSCIHFRSHLAITFIVDLFERINK